MMDIPSVDEVRKKLSGVSDFCYQHPGLAGPLIIGWIGLTFKDAIKTTMSIALAAQTIWGRVTRPRTFEKIGKEVRAFVHEKGLKVTTPGAVWATFVLVILVGGSIVTARTIGKLGRPRPQFDGLPASVLSSKFTVHWKYNDPERPGGLKYRLRALNEKHQQEWQSPDITVLRTPLEWRGKGYLQVDLLENGSVLTSSEMRPFEIYDDSVARAAATGLLRVGVHVDDTQGGWCHNSDHGIAGFDKDLATTLVKYVAKRIGKPVAVFIQDEEWPHLLELPKEDAVDMAIASISINEQREKDFEALFSHPYFKTVLSYVTQRDQRGAGSEAHVADLCGKNIGVHVGTTAETFAGHVKEECKGKVGVHPFPNNSDLVDALGSQGIDGFIYDFARSRILCRERKDLIAVTFAAADLDRCNQPAEEYGVIFSRRNWKLESIVSAAIDDIRKENRLAASYESVGGTL
jgi:ABC-type amino acid transport substrate-binding protein